MKYQPIILGTGREGTGTPKQSIGVKNANPQDLRVRIFGRDDYTCRCCGFRSEKYQEIHYINGNESDMSEENMITTCVFCKACFNLKKADEQKSGVLIWLPEIGQAALNHIIRAIYVGRIAQGGIGEASRKALDLLMARKDECKRRVGTDDPGVLGSVMNDFIERKKYNQREELLKGVRFLPLDRIMSKEDDTPFNKFPQILAYWRSKNGPFAELNPKIWSDLYDKIKKIDA